MARLQCPAVGCGGCTVAETKILAEHTKMKLEKDVSSEQGKQNSETTNLLLNDVTDRTQSYFQTDTQANDILSQNCRYWLQSKFSEPGKMHTKATHAQYNTSYTTSGTLQHVQRITPNMRTTNKRTRKAGDKQSVRSIGFNARMVRDC
eukprot:1305432-Amphidinium_carterae.1